MSNLTKSMFDPSLMERAYPSLFRLMRYTRLPCSLDNPEISPGHLIQTCSWAGRKVDCRNLFTPTITDHGICCSFNLQHNLREERCKDGEMADEFPCLVRELQGGERDQPVRKANVGADMGLQIVLDQHSNLNSLQTLHMPDQGFRMFIGQPGTFPLLGQDVLLVAPGQNHQIRLDASVVSSTAAVAELDPASRDCLFPSERPLTHHSRYSQGACEFECALAAAAQSFGSRLP